MVCHLCMPLCRVLCVRVLSPTTRRLCNSYCPSRSVCLSGSGEGKRWEGMGMAQLQLLNPPLGHVDIIFETFSCCHPVVKSKLYIIDSLHRCKNSVSRLQNVRYRDFKLCGTENTMMYQHIVSLCSEITVLPSAHRNTKYPSAEHRICTIAYRKAYCCLDLAQEVFCIISTFVQNCNEPPIPPDSR